MSSLRNYLTEHNNELLLEGKMEDELANQIANMVIKKKDKKALSVIYHFILNRGSGQPDLQQLKKDKNYIMPFATDIASQCLAVDTTKKKTFRYLIKDWVMSGEIVLKEDGPQLARDIQMYAKAGANRKDFSSRADFGEFVDKMKKTGVVDDMFNYTFDIDYDDGKRFTIYTIQEKDRAEYIANLGHCTTWCISTEQMFGIYPLPYYLLVDKKEKKQYAIVPTGGQFRDSKQNVANSEARFEEFDKILDLRGRYFYDIMPADTTLLDTYIYTHPSFNKRASDEVKEGLGPELVDIMLQKDFNDLSDGDIIMLRNHFLETLDTFNGATQEGDHVVFTFKRWGKGAEQSVEDLEHYYNARKGDVSFDFFLQVIKGEYHSEADYYEDMSGVLRYNNINDKNKKTIEDLLDKENSDWREEYEDIEEAIMGMDMDDIKEAIEEAYRWSWEGATSDEIWKDAVNALEDAGFEMDYDREAVVMKIDVNKEPEKIFNIMQDGEDPYNDNDGIIVFDQPYHGWSGTVTDDHFNENLTEKLYDIA